VTRVAVFVDYQNTYMRVREAFGWTDAHFTLGQVFPRRLGVLLTDRGRHGANGDPSRQLEKVMVFRGEPSAAHSTVAQGANQRQVRYWQAQAAVEVVTRPLRYSQVGVDRRGDPIVKAQEKGIDVLIALSMVMGAMRDQFDVAVLVSADTDLVPALEVVCTLGKRCEVASWRDPADPIYRSRLRVKDRRIWCHWLDEPAYRRVEDATDYTQPQRGEPPTV
jgi:hypothetical protein